MSKFREYLEYYKKKLERNINDENTVQHVFEKLGKTEFPVNDLLGTGIYKTVRAICKSDGEFADKALPLYNKWKLLILAEQNGQNKSFPAALKAPPAHSEAEAQDILKSLPSQPIDLKNGLADVLRSKTGFSEVESAVKPFAKDGLPKGKSSITTPGLGPFRGLEGANEASSKAKSSSQSSGNAYHSYNSNDGAYKMKDSSASQPPVNKFQPFSNFDSLSDAGCSSKGSVPAQSSGNAFHPFSSFNSLSQPAPGAKLENSLEQNPPDFCSNFDTHSNLSNPCSSPNSTSSQNHLDIGTPGTSSPSKVGRIPDPYTIDMREGMFRVVKSSEGLTPDIIRVRRLYTQEEELGETEAAGDSKAKVKVKNDQLEKTDSSRDVTDKNATDQKHSSSHKHHGTPVKEGKAVSSADKSAIEKAKHKEKHESSRSERHFSPHKSSSKSSRNSSPKPPSSKESPLVRPSSRGSPSTKSSSRDNLVKSRGSPSAKPVSKEHSKSATRGSPSNKSRPHESSSKEGSSKSGSRDSPVKSSIRGSSPLVLHSSKEHSYKPLSKGSPSSKSNGKRSPHNQNVTSSREAKKAKLTPKDCDKKPNRISSSNAAESFMSSKKERTSVYSGKKSLQEVPSLHASCIRFLQKNIECIKTTRRVPYEVLKPVLMYCHPSQLCRLEENNMYLLHQTDEIWKLHCQKLSRDARPHSPGTWRELYWRVKEDQSRKLKDLTASISASKLKTAPERQAMLTESPERPRKKMRVSTPESKEAAVRPTPKESAHNSAHKESNSSNNLVHKLTKDVPPVKTSKEPLPQAQRKVKKGPVAPLMSKVKKTIGGLIAMHKK